EKLTEFEFLVDKLGRNPTPELIKVLQSLSDEIQSLIPSLGENWWSHLKSEAEGVGDEFNQVKNRMKDASSSDPVIVEKNLQEIARVRELGKKMWQENYAELEEVEKRVHEQLKKHSINPLFTSEQLKHEYELQKFLLQLKPTIDDCRPPIRTYEATTDSSLAFGISGGLACILTGKKLIFWDENRKMSDVKKVERDLMERYNIKAITSTPSALIFFRPEGKINAFLLIKCLATSSSQVLIGLLLGYSDEDLRAGVIGRQWLAGTLGQHHGGSRIKPFIEHSRRESEFESAKSRAERWIRLNTSSIEKWIHDNQRR